MSNGKTVFVGLSGGVDSSVSALRLKKQGYNVVGVFIKVWHPEWMVCNWEEERLDAMRVAAKLEIPFLTCDAQTAYKEGVADYFISEYKAGRTPNPDVMCNKYVKFAHFLNFAQANGADFIATGHYVRRVLNNGTYHLLRGHDSSKDQSYFLWTLTQKQLSKTLFPVGDTAKSDIRKEALSANLQTAAKKDSQGICFLGQIDIPEFLSHYVELKKGKVLDISGKVIGDHQGALVYTIGQRHGFTVQTSGSDQKPHYVINRDLDKNTITVSQTKPTMATSEKISLVDCNFVNQNPVAGEEVEIQNRYRQRPIKARVTSVKDLQLSLELIEPSESVSAGQSCVLYRRDECLGGGIITG
jgi:tRNA-specific 2-thiouridylase